MTKLQFKQFVPTYHQKSIYDSNKRFRVVAGAIGTGKTYVSVYDAIKQAYQNKYVVYLVDSYSRYKELSFAFKRALEDSGLSHSMSLLDYNYKLTNLGEIKIISLRQSAGHRADHLIIDQTEVVNNRDAEPIITHVRRDGSFLLSGIPVEPEGMFYQLYQYALMSDDDNWQAWQLKLDANPYLTEDYIKQAQGIPEPIRSQLLAGEFKTNFKENLL